MLNSRSRLIFASSLAIDRRLLFQHNHLSTNCRAVFYRLPEHKFISVIGIDAKQLLQGLCTNDVYKLKKKGDSIAATFLSAKGRILADTILYDCSREGGYEEVLIEVHSALFEDLKRLITMYKLRSKVKLDFSSIKSTLLLPITPLSTRTFADQVLDEDILQMAYQSFSFLFAKDPRLRVQGNIFTSRDAPFGIRLLHPPETLDSTISSKLVSLGARPGSNSDYQRFRLLHGLACGRELLNDIPLECNLDLLDSISFTKGCYLGQELTARTKYKGLVRKRIVPFSLRDPLPVKSSENQSFPALTDTALPSITVTACEGDTELPVVRGPVSYEGMTSGSMDEQLYAKGMGEIVCVNKESGLGLALVRLEAFCWPSSEPIRHIVAEGSRGGRVRIYPFKPVWWPRIDPVTGKLVLDAELFKSEKTP